MSTPVIADPAFRLSLVDLSVDLELELTEY
jgi:hypothetical protein